MLLHHRLPVLLLHHHCEQRCYYCSILRINNRRFSSYNNSTAWTMHPLKSTHSHSTLSHTDIYRFGASLCNSATCLIISKSVRHVEWVRNNCYCIEVPLVTMVTLVNIMVMNGWLTTFSIHVNWLSYSWVKTISDSDLETSRPRSCVWSKGKVIQLAQYPIILLPFHFRSIRPSSSSSSTRFRPGRFFLETALVPSVGLVTSGHCAANKLGVYVCIICYFECSF